MKQNVVCKERGRGNGLGDLYKSLRTTLSSSFVSMMWGMVKLRINKVDEDSKILFRYHLNRLS